MKGTRFIDPVSIGATGDIDKDCCIRALCNVLDVPYKLALEKFIDNGFTIGRGSQFNTFHRVYTAMGLKQMGTFGTTKPAKYYSRMSRTLTAGEVQQNKGMTLGTFLKKYNSGKYIVVYKGHALAVVNGQVLDTFSSPAGKRVTVAYAVV